MRHLARACLCAVLLPSLAASTFAQATTGLEPDRKSSAGGSWSADATVARFVYGPIKLLGTGRFTPAGRIALKGPMDRAESGVREVMARLSAGEIDEREARVQLADVIAAYRVAVRKLLAAR